MEKGVGSGRKGLPWRGCYFINGPVRLVIALGILTIYIPRYGMAPEVGWRWIGKGGPQ